MSARHRFRNVFVGLLVAGIGAIPVAASGATAPRAKVLPTVIAATEALAPEAPYYFAVEHGYYKEFGLNVQLVSLANSTAITAAMEAGSIDFGTLSPDPVAVYAKTGLAFPAVYGGTDYATYFNVFCNNQVPTPAKSATGKQLIKMIIGKKIGFSGIGSTPYWGLYQALAFNGYNINDVTLVSVGTGTPEYAALESGSIACVIGDANVIATQTGGAWGGHELFTFATKGISDPTYLKLVGPTTVNPTFARTHKREVIDFIRGTMKAYLYFESEKDKPSLHQAMVAAVGPAAPALGSDLNNFLKAWLPTVSLAFGPANVRATYNFDLTAGLITRLPNFNPYRFVGPGAPVTNAQAAILAAGGPAQKY